MKQKRKIGSVTLCFLLAFLFLASSMFLIIGTDTAWGKVEVTRLNLTSADGDQISAMMYKPKAAQTDNKVPMVMLCHGGNDMFEQMGSYALELARRGYAAITWDYTGCHNSDIPTGTSETAPGEVSGLPTMGAETVWNAVKSLNFVDFDKIICMGHSMGGQYTMAFSIAHQQEVFLQLNLGMNMYGVPENQEHNFNFVNVLGVADESCLARSENNVSSLFQAEQIRRIFFADYTSEADALPQIEIGKVYMAAGSDGEEYTRTAYMPESCHAYYLVTNDAVKTVIYAITSQVGIGLDAGVSSYADHSKISTVWQGKDVGFALLFVGTVMLMFSIGAGLMKTSFFAGLCLSRTEVDPGFEKKTPLRYIAMAVLFIIPVALYRVGILASNKFLGIDISGLWLIGGTNNTYISWQWTVAIALLVFFLTYHFAWGKKHGGNLHTYGFATAEEKGFHFAYVVRALLFGLLTVGGGYLTFTLVCAYTKQGMHIATFMLSPINTNRTLCIIMYFLFQIPYFITSSLAFKSLGNIESGNETKDTLKTIGRGLLISIGGLFMLWLVFILILTNAHTLTSSPYFMTNRMYIYTIAILPLCIGMTVANALNIYLERKTNSIWPGLFVALFWGSWIIISCGGMAKYIY